MAGDAPDAASSPNLRDAPMRAISLATAVDPSLWLSPNLGDCPHLSSFVAPGASHFLSHSWRDGGRRKVALIRNALFLQDYYAQVFVMGSVLALVWLPPGMILDEVSGGAFKFWVPSLVMLYLALFAAAAAWALPARFGPMKESGLTLWLDKICIDQRSEAAKQLGISLLHEYLLRCDHMTVFFSPSYLSRLWCVFELASYCKAHGADPKRLNFLGLDWPPWYAPGVVAGQLLGRGPALSPAERDLLANFSCRTARCFRPFDRVTVLGKVRRWWGSEDAFDAFVRDELPAILLAGKRRYERRALFVLADTATFLFG